MSPFAKKPAGIAAGCLYSVDRDVYRLYIEKQTLTAPVAEFDSGAHGDLAAAVRDQIQSEFGLVPEPLALHAPVPDLYAAAWAILRETVLVGGRLGRPAKEAMAVAISAGNRCPYCVDAHGVALHSLGEGAVETALRRGRASRLDSPLEALVAWAVASGRAGEPLAARPPFGPAEMPEAVGTVLCFQYINRMVTVLLPEHLLPRWLRRPLLTLLGRRLRRFAAVPLAPGDSLRRLAPAPPARPARGPRLAWAEGAPPIAAAFAAMGEATAAAIEPLLSPTAQVRVVAHLADWRGEDPPFGFDWMEEALAGLAAEEAAVARLGLLTALAPHRVGAEEVAAFRRHHPGDAALVGALAWACFGTAERMAQWVVPAPSAFGQ